MGNGGEGLRPEVRPGDVFLLGIGCKQGQDTGAGGELHVTVAAPLRLDLKDARVEVGQFFNVFGDEAGVDENGTGAGILRWFTRRRALCGKDTCRGEAEEQGGQSWGSHRSIVQSGIVACRAFGDANDNFGGRCRTRTYDLLRVKQAL